MILNDFGIRKRKNKMEGKIINNKTKRQDKRIIVNEGIINNNFGIGINNNMRASSGLMRMGVLRLK